MIVRSLPRRHRPPSVFVMQINHHPILAFEAVSTSEARELVKEDWFLTDLRKLRSGGKAVWDGQAYLQIGPAAGEQVDEVRCLLQRTPKTEEIPIVYLIKVDEA